VEVIKEVMCGCIESKVVMFFPVAEGFLESAEKASASWECHHHAAKFPKELVPLLDGYLGTVSGDSI